MVRYGTKIKGKGFDIGKKYEVNESSRYRMLEMKKEDICSFFVISTEQLVSVYNKVRFRNTKTFFKLFFLFVQHE